MNDAITIREISPADADAAAELSGQLGYPVSSDAMKQRIEAAALSDRIVLVACTPDRPHVVGWIDVSVVHHLQNEPYGEIGGLVVASDCRNLGIGQRLVARAEEWIRGKDITRIVVRSQISREAAHRFYLRERYTRWKTSAVFSKELNSTPGR
ncbi:MAG: GNAT family N-acetyltransferase [Bryobacteraceae bacterium]